MPSNTEKKGDGSSNLTVENKKTEKKGDGSSNLTVENKKRKGVESYDPEEDKRMKILQNKSAMEELVKAMKSDKNNWDMLMNQMAIVKKNIQDMLLDIELAESDILVLEKKFVMNISQVTMNGGIKDQIQILDIQENCLKLKLSQLTEYKNKFTV